MIVRSKRISFSICIAFALLVAAPGAVVAQIDLGDITGGGDGTGDGTNTAINILDGSFADFATVTANAADPGRQSTGARALVPNLSEPDLSPEINPKPVAGSMFVDSVDIIDGGEDFTGAQAINTDGGTYEFRAEDQDPLSHRYIISNHTHRLSGDAGADTGADAEGNLVEGVSAGGRDWGSGVGVHSSAFITFNLEAIRAEHGAANVGQLAAFVGHAECNADPTLNPGITAYIVFSDAAGIIGDATLIEVRRDGGAGVGVNTPIQNEGEAVLMAIPSEADYLTLAVGRNFGGNRGTGEDAQIFERDCDMGVFANALILPDTFTPGACDDLQVSPDVVGVPSDGSLPTQLEVVCFDAAGVVTPASAETASGTAYSSDPAGVVNVSATGEVTGATIGSTEITVTNAGGSSTVQATVFDETICQSIEIFPNPVLVAPGGSDQLQVLCTNLLDQVSDVAAEASYSVEPGGVASVSPTGSVTALTAIGGRALITVTASGITETVPVLISPHIDLGDVVAGGDGTGRGGGERGDRAHSGIDLDVGTLLTTSELQGVCGETGDVDGTNPSAVAGSTFVDSVFFISATTQAVTQSGVEIDFQGGDGAGVSNGGLLSNYIPMGFCSSGIPFQQTAIEAGRRTDWNSAVGISGSAGVTFDLDALRAEHGADNVKRFACQLSSAILNPNGNIEHRLYVIYSDDAGVVMGPRTTGGSPYYFATHVMQDRDHYDELIPDGAKYLTLAVGAAVTGGEEGNFAAASAAFTNATILPADALGCFSLRARPDPVTVNVDGEQQVKVTCRDVVGLDRVVTTAADGTTYEIDPPSGIMSLENPDGTFKGVGRGEVTITATNGTATGEFRGVVEDFLSLPDMVAGGDGLGSGSGELGTREFVGINVADGSFSTFGSHLWGFRARPDGERGEDGCCNPTTVPDSPFIDSVFSINSDDPAVSKHPGQFGLNTGGQVNNTDGSRFEWPREDILADAFDNDGTQWGGGPISNYTWRAVFGDPGLGIGAEGDIPGGPENTRNWAWGNIYLYCSGGITFDLDAIRDEYGADAVSSVSTGVYAANGQTSPGLTTNYVIFSDDTEVIPSPVVPSDSENPEYYKVKQVVEDPFSAYGTRQDRGGTGAFYETPIPAGAKYLTFATGMGGGDWFSDATDFANARINSNVAGDPLFRRGDHDGSGQVDITDPVNLLTFLFIGGFDPICEDASDADNSGAIDISDAVNTLTFLFLGTIAIPLPGHDNCGPDPAFEIDDGNDPPPNGPDGLPAQPAVSLGCDSYPADGGTACP